MSVITLTTCSSHQEIGFLQCLIFIRRLRKLFTNKIYTLFICKIWWKWPLQAFVFYCKECRILGFHVVRSTLLLQPTPHIASNKKQAAETCFITANNALAKVKLDSDGSSDDWWLLDGCPLTHILLDTHLKWGTLLTLLCISIYSIFGLMWFATRWNKCKLSEASRIIADVKQELLTPPFNFSADTSELDSSVHQSHFSAMLFLQMDNLLGEVIFHYLLSLWLSVDFLLFHHRFIISCIACNLLNSDLITAIAHSFQPFVNFEVTKI